MPPKIKSVSDVEYARQQKELAARCVRAEVTGAAPIRDAVTRESVEAGGAVRLDPTTTNLDLLVSMRAIALIDDEPAPAGAETGEPVPADAAADEAPAQPEA